MWSRSNGDCAKTGEPAGLTRCPPQPVLLRADARSPARASHDRGLCLFAQIDHAANAERARLQMPPTTLLVFGHPATGTPLMLAAPDLAIELPSRILVREEQDGSVSVLHHDAGQLGQRFGRGTSWLAGDARAASPTGA